MTNADTSLRRAALPILTVCGIEELDGHRAARVGHVLSILDPGHPDPVAFASYDPHHRTILRFHDIIEPVPGMVLPQIDDVKTIVAFGEEIAGSSEDEGHLLIHCHLGISRSTAAMTTMLTLARPDETEDEIVARLETIRPHAWPNARMIGFADEILGRGGRLSDAASRLHARQLAAKPHLAKIFRELGRAAEVDRAQAWAT